jgi:hypothetical protein
VELVVVVVVAMVDNIVVDFVVVCFLRSRRPFFIYYLFKFKSNIILQLKISFSNDEFNRTFLAIFILYISNNNKYFNYL